MVKVNLEVYTEYNGTKCNGNLVFKKPDGELKIDYFFAPGKLITKSLAEGDEVDLTFKVDTTEMPIKGIFPEALLDESVSERAQCLWVVSQTLIWQNFFMISETGGGVSQKQEGEMREEMVKLIFGG